MEKGGAGRRRAGLAIVLTAVVAWSMAALFTRLLALDAPTMLFWRGAFGALGLFTLTLLPRFGGWRTYAALGWTGTAYSVVSALSMVCFISALRQTSVAHIAVITATVPLVSALLGFAALGERPGRSALAASLAALAGVAIMVGFGTQGHWTGDALAGAMALGMGVMIILSRMAAFPALPASTVASGMSAVFVVPFATLSGLPMQDLILLACFAFVNQVVGFGLFAVGSTMLPAVETALITTLEAPLAPFWVWLVAGERPETAAIVGGTLVLTAVVLHILRQAGRPVSH